MKIFVFIISACFFFNVQAMDKAESFKRIQNQLQNPANADISVIVELEDTFGINFSEDQSLRRSASMKTSLMSRLSRLGVREHKRFKTLPVMALQVNEKGLKELEKNPNVKKVYQNQLRKHSLASSTIQIQANQAWARNQAGDGVAVAVVDAGFINYHDMFNGADKVLEEACFTTNATIQGIRVFSNCWPDNSTTRIGPGSANPSGNPTSAGNDHGSLVAGVAAGKADEYSPILTGVAREASVIAVNVFSRVENQNFCGLDSLFGVACVVALDSDVLAGLDYVYSLRNQHDIAAVNLSLGGGAFRNACDVQSVYTAVINRLKNAGIAVVAAAGNDGSGTTISEPACVSNAIAVGSVGDTNVVSDFTNSNNLIDFWAPGENIRTSNGVCVNCYETVNGTSFSAPHVTGAFAILKSYNKNLTVDEITTALKTTGLPIRDPLNGITRPLIQISDALDILPRTLGIIPIFQLLLLDDE